MTEPNNIMKDLINEKKNYREILIKKNNVRIF